MSGITCGLIGFGEEVVWEADHFHIRFRLKSKITAFEPPYHFRDSMIDGPFKFFEHDHYFSQDDTATTMKDVFCFEAPFGLIGRLVDAIILVRYLRRFLVKRNRFIKNVAESDKWMVFLNSNST